MQRRNSTAAWLDRKGVLCARLRQPQDDVAVALAGTAQRAQPIDDVGRKPNQPLAVGAGFGLVAHAAEHRPPNYLEKAATAPRKSQRKKLVAIDEKVAEAITAIALMCDGGTCSEGAAYVWPSRPRGLGPRTWGIWARGFHFSRRTRRRSCSVLGGAVGWDPCLAMAPSP